MLWKEPEAVCECTDHVDSVGYGDCKVEYQGSIGCYAKQPSACTDLTNAEGGDFSAAEACQSRGKLKIQIERINDISNLILDRINNF